MSDDRSPGEWPSLPSSRRAFLLGAGSLGAVAVGAMGTFLALTGQSAGERTYILRQGYLRWEIDPLSHGDATVEEFYGYRSSSANPAVDVVDEDAASRLFIYEGPVGSSLAFLHGSPAVDHGGTASFAFSGLPRSKGEWAVRDDPTGRDDDFEAWESGNARVNWEWGPGQTDGGAYWGVLDRNEFTITVTPKTLRGVDAWKALSGDIESPTAFELHDGNPATIRPAGPKEVKEANVEIMPGTDPNAFDPYSTERLTVAVRAPPSDADPAEWVTPTDVDPGNYSVYFGSKGYLAGGNGASPQKYFREDGTLYLKYEATAANFTLDSAHGFVVGKTGETTWFRGRDAVRPGGFDNVETEEAQLVVTDLNVDPDGGDRRNLAAEYVEFENDGDESLDMTDYVVVDGEGWKFYLPDGFTLDPSGRFRLHTGEGEWDEDDLYWGLDTSVWGNDGDTITVLDGDGTTVLAYTYPRR
ncbi:MAG: lamin tail domain-containing protein [Haloplanus sp.]